MRRQIYGYLPNHTLEDRADDDRVNSGDDPSIHMVETF